VISERKWCLCTVRQYTEPEVRMNGTEVVFTARFQL
jgi:hypothetical protein